MLIPLLCAAILILAAMSPVWAQTPCDQRAVIIGAPLRSDWNGWSPALFSGSLDGHLRAYSAEDGKVVWDFDTVRDFDTVNRVQASGGGIDGHGPVAAGGMVYAGSGYQRTGGMGGNVLLAFGAGE